MADKTMTLRNPKNGVRVTIAPISGTRGAYSVLGYRRGMRTPYATSMCQSWRDAVALACYGLNMKPCYIRRDQTEVGTGKPGYRWARAFPLVSFDAPWIDLVQPWPKSLRDARDQADSMGYCVIGVLDDSRNPAAFVRPQTAQG